MSTSVDQSAGPVTTWIVAAFPATPVRLGNQQSASAAHHIIVLPPGRTPRLPGTATPHDVWVIPAQYRSVLAARRPMIEFCEIALPDRILGPGQPTKPRIEPRHPLTPRLLERLQRLSSRGDLGSRLLTESITETLRLHLIDYLAAQRQDSVHRPLDRDEQAHIVNHIDTPEADTRVAALAAQVNMSVPAFTAAFVETFHTSPRQFVLDRRISRAKELLGNSNRSITEIAVDVGFATHSHFCTTFRNRVGVTPSEYRSTSRALAGDTGR